MVNRLLKRTVDEFRRVQRKLCYSGSCGKGKEASVERSFSSKFERSDSV